MIIIRLRIFLSLSDVDGSGWRCRGGSDGGGGSDLWRARCTLFAIVNDKKNVGVQGPCASRTVAAWTVGFVWGDGCAGIRIAIGSVSSSAASIRYKCQWIGDAAAGGTWDKGGDCSTQNVIRLSGSPGRLLFRLHPYPLFPERGDERVSKPARARQTERESERERDLFERELLHFQAGRQAG